MDAFATFLRTGAINGLRVGMSESQVLDARGAPDDVSAIKPRVWKYGETEITFREEQVVMLAMYVTGHSGYVETLLAKARAVLTLVPALTYDDQEAYVIDESGVSLTVDTADLSARGFAC